MNHRATRRRRRLGSAIALLATAVGLGLAATNRTAVFAVQPAAESPRESDPAWRERLEELDPGEPMNYFLLGEEVADAGRSSSERELARTLFGLAGALDPPRLGRSAALALADLAETDVERRRLLALATLLSDDLLQPPLTHRGSDGVTIDEAGIDAILAVTEAFSHYRRGQGAMALTALRERNADALLDACGKAIPGGAARFREDCRNYRGALRPSLTDGEIVRLLRLEQALLAGGERPMSAELLVAENDPLVEVDPTDLADSFGVDPNRSIYLNGQWIPAPRSNLR